VSDVERLRASCYALELKVIKVERERNEARAASEAFKRELDHAVKNLQAALYREKENVRTINRYLAERDEARKEAEEALKHLAELFPSKADEFTPSWLRD
jgi:hypothetical protein